MGTSINTAQTQHKHSANKRGPPATLGKWEHTCVLVAGWFHMSVFMAGQTIMGKEKSHACPQKTKTTKQSKGNKSKSRERKLPQL